MEIKDVSGLPVAANFKAFDTSSTAVTKTITFCGSIKDFVVPDGADRINVWVGVFGNAPAMNCGKPAPGTTGTITASGSAVSNWGKASPATIRPGPATVRAQVATLPAARPATAARAGLFRLL